MKRFILTIMALAAITVAGCGDKKEAAPVRNAQPVAAHRLMELPKLVVAPNRTPAETVACMNASLKERPFTGTYSTRLAQARHLKSDATVIIDGTPVSLPQGSTIWKPCAGPSLEQRMVALNASYKRLYDFAVQQDRELKRLGRLNTDLTTTVGTQQDKI